MADVPEVSDFESFASWVTALRSTGLTWSKISKIVGVERRQLFRMRSSMPAEVHLNDDELFGLITTIKDENPHFGEVYIKGAILQQGFKVTRQRIRDCIKEIDGDGVAQRRRPRIVRCIYHVPGAMFLWHMDGNEKLQMFKIYLHGCVDGHSRKVIYMKCDSNKKASTPLKSFQEAALQYGLPRFLRMDKGGENVHVYLFMQENLEALGHQRSVILGPSVRNQRIERFWREINQITLKYKNLFYLMDSQSLLDTNDPVHIFALHYIYLPRIQQSLDEFVETWDFHGIRTARFQTPASMFLTQQYDHSFPVTYQSEEEEDQEDMLEAERNDFARGIIPDPLMEDENCGVDLYINLVNAIYESSA